MNIEKTIRRPFRGKKKNKTKKSQSNFGPERLFSTLELGSLVIERRFVRQLKLIDGMFELSCLFSCTYKSRSIMILNIISGYPNTHGKHVLPSWLRGESGTCTMGR